MGLRASLPAERQMARTLAEHIATRLREQIVTGVLKPGQPLLQEAIAEELSVSRVPVRDALRILAADELIQLESHKGAVVAVFSNDELREILTIIRTLEALATGQGVAALSGENLDQMEVLLDRMAEVSDRPADWNRLNEKFHSVGTCAPLGGRIHRLIERHRLCIARYFYDPAFFEQQVGVWNQQHRAIYDASRSGDMEEARRRADFHWEYSADALLGYLNNK